MRKYLKRIAYLALFVPISALAQIKDYNVLAPLPKIGDAGGTTNIQTYLPAAFNLTIAIAAVLAFVMITLGGIIYATSDAITKKEQGKGYIWNAIWGLILVISSWLIINTINPKMLDFSFLNKMPGPEIVATSTAYVGAALTPEEIADDARVRAILATPPDDVYVYAAICSTGQTKNCVNMNGLPDNAIYGLKHLRKDCKCAITVTGGTEAGHKSHGPGSPVVDIRPNSTLNTFLGYPNPTNGVTNRSVAFKDGGHANFYYETTAQDGSTGNHWHVTFGP